jgi:hypothetical protein
VAAKDNKFYKMGSDMKWVLADPPQAIVSWVNAFRDQYEWHDSKDYIYTMRAYIHEIDKKTGEVKHLKSQYSGGQVWGCAK